MRFISEQRFDDGVLEREFTLGDIPGILWTPASGAAPAPLILMGHPGGVRKMYPRLVARARHAAASGYAAVTIELPGGGDRPRIAAVEEARQVAVPLLVLLQWDDEGNDRQMALDLFDAFGSKEKTLQANMGGHTGVPRFAGEEAGRFFDRHLR